jgi:hypothetical protein
MVAEDYSVEVGVVLVDSDSYQAENRRMMAEDYLWV